MNSEEYLFYEWIILGKGLSKEELVSMSEGERIELVKEYNKFREGLK